MRSPNAARNDSARGENAVLTVGDLILRCKAVVPECLKIIAPPPEDRDVCRVFITTIVELTLTTLRTPEPLPRPERLSKISVSLRRAVPALGELKEVFETAGRETGRSEDDLTKQLDEAISTLNIFADCADKLAQKLEKPRDEHGGRQHGPNPNFGKTLCAVIALRLLEKFGVAVTETADGPYYRLAALLYEGVFGARDQSLERQCRRIFHQRSSGLPLVLPG
jgi:hypothetical protein